ncbi:MAG: helix-turn-helix domain-containing protein [Clostridiales bacterium]|nr:helix-turn-helix domain-containing protein [Clostridiales bacterium]
MDVTDKEYASYLMHYGTPRHSGRYPWGSGDNPYQRNANFRAYILDLRHQGMTDAEIARGMGMSKNDMLAALSRARAENRAEDVAEAKRLIEKGYSQSAAARRMGINESQVRNLLKEDIQIRANRTADLAEQLKNDLDEKGGYIDVGAGSEQYIGTTRYVWDNAVSKLKSEGYEVHNIKVTQAGTGKDTTVQVLAAPGTTWAEVMNNKGDIRIVNAPYDDSSPTGRSKLGLERPVALDPKRMMIRYKDDIGPDGGRGIEKDGVIELRRGVEDISLGSANYAQVRINVGDSHYLKGMAVYSDDMPDGVDVIFNTNKTKDVPIFGSKDNSILKELKKNKETGEIDWDNPFGATIKGEKDLAMAQRYFTDKDGKKKLSTINIVNEEGDWETWAPTLSSQFLSKQTPAMAKQQLKIASDARQAEYDDIMSLTNPTVKKKLLQEFADECDSAAVHLKAAALPRQSSHVILPVPGLKETEIFAPNYRNGEQVALVRHPHAGRFEIPLLTVNNNSKAAAKVVGKNSPDAVGINAKTAAILSGADFDGDTVLVIPTRGTNLKAQKPLKGLKDFEPKDEYRAYPGMPETSKKNGFNKQMEMGKVSNLITDMTLKGATDSELTRAVKHSMVVIDAEKHNLDWRRSARENGISDLKRKYQGGPNAGAATLISRAKGEKRVGERKEIAPDKRTGERRYIYTDREYEERKKNKETGLWENTGHIKKAQSKTTNMADAKDAHSLSSGTIMEGIYADHANRLKSLANSARKEALATEAVPYSPSARKVYAKEVASLDAKYKNAQRNKPLERQAQLITETVVRAKKRANPDISDDPDRLKKIQNQALKEARERTGAKKSDFDITDREWEAIQAGAIHKTRLEALLSAADSDRVKELALPRTEKKINPSVISRAKSMRASGKTQAEIADSLGLSTTTVNSMLRS